MNPGALLIYARGNRPALYVAPYGLRHVIQVKHWGKPALVYVRAASIRPVTP